MRVHPGKQSANPFGVVFDGSAGRHSPFDSLEAVLPASMDRVPNHPSPTPRLASLYPSVVFLLDVFDKPASEKTVEYLQKIVDAGVHVVFLTWRPQKGPHSAEEMLLGRMKHGRENPIIVASYNGGKISLHGRAADPKPLLPQGGPETSELAGFTKEETLKLRSMAASLAKPLHLREPLVERPYESDGQVLSFVVSLPASVPEGKAAAARDALVKKFNAALAEAGLPYRMSPHPDDPRSAITHSMPLRFSLPRIFQALEAQFHSEWLLNHPEKFLILSDSLHSQKFSSAFQDTAPGAEIQVVASGGQVEETLGEVLGTRSLKGVSIQLGKLRQYLEYWEPAVSGRSEYSAGGGRTAFAPEEKAFHQKFKMYAGGVIYQLMTWLYDEIWCGQDFLASLDQVQARLAAMWKDPARYGVPVSKSQLALMKTPGWQAMSKGYLAFAMAFLNNYWMREFADFGAAARNVRYNKISLSSDPKSLITLEFESPSTGKLYKIHTRIPRLMKLDTAHGRVLTAYSYRTSKETPDDGDEAYAKVLAMAILKGHGRKGPDGRWHHGAPDGEPIAKLQVQFEYRSSHRVWVFNPEDFLTFEEGRESTGPVVRDLTAAIERMEADGEYQKYYSAEQEKASAEDLAAAKAEDAGAPEKK
jgi:hypothetical protein